MLTVNADSAGCDDGAENDQCSGVQLAERLVGKVQGGEWTLDAVGFERGF